MAVVIAVTASSRRPQNSLKIKTRIVLSADCLPATFPEWKPSLCETGCVGASALSVPRPPPAEAPPWPLQLSLENIQTHRGGIRLEESRKYQRSPLPDSPAPHHHCRPSSHGWTPCHGETHAHVCYLCEDLSVQSAVPRRVIATKTLTLNKA